MGAETIDVLVTRAVRDVDSYSRLRTTALLQLELLVRHATPEKSTTSTMEKAIRRRASVPKDFGTTAHELNTLNQSSSSTTHIELDRRAIHRLVMANSDDRHLAIIRALRVLHVSSGPIRAWSWILTIPI